MQEFARIKFLLRSFIVQVAPDNAKFTIMTGTEEGPKIGEGRLLIYFLFLSSFLYGQNMGGTSAPHPLPVPSVLDDGADKKMLLTA